MDNEFSYDEYTPALEEETVILTKEVPEDTEIEVKITTKKKEKPKFKFSPKMLLAPGVMAIYLIVSTVSGTLLNFISPYIMTLLGSEFRWLTTMLSGAEDIISAVIFLVLVAAAGYLCYKNISKALKFMAGCFAAWGVGLTVSSVVYLIFSIVLQLVYNNREYEIYSVLTGVTGIVQDVAEFIITVAVSILFVMLIEKADAKKAQEEKMAQQEASPVEEAIDEIVEEIYEETVEEVIEEIAEEVEEEISEEKAKKLKKKSLAIDKKATILMAVAAIIAFLSSVPLSIIEMIFGSSYGWQKWIMIAGGANWFITNAVALVACAALGFLASKKLDGAIKFFGAYKIAGTAVGIIGSVVFTIINVFSVLAGGISTTVANIISFVVNVPVFLLTLVLAVVLINLFDIGLNFKKKSKKAKKEAEQPAEEAIEAVETSAE